MNSKGFKNFSRNLNTNNFGSNPRALLPLAVGGALAYLLYKGIYYGKTFTILVDVGHFAIKFNKLSGLSPKTYKEGFNFKIPVLEEAIIYNVQTREK